MILAGIIISAFPVDLHAQEATFSVPGGDTLIVTGENFTYETVVSVIEGEEVIQEQAIWDGGVVACLSTADYGEIKLETGHVTAVFEGRDVTRLEAGPEVIFTGQYGRAVFECTDVVIDFPANPDGTETYEGICTDVRGYYLASPQEMNLEGDDYYEVNFTAAVAKLGPDEAVLIEPCLSLGDIDDPDIAVRSREILFNIGENPATGERAILGLRAPYFAFDLFGTSARLIPFAIWRGFVKDEDPGFANRLPRVGWESDEYLRIDQSIIYTLNDPRFDIGPRFIARFDMFPFARSYPEFMIDAESDGFFYGIRAGYRREEDSEGYPVPTRAEPELWVTLNRMPIGDQGFEIGASAFYGHIRDMRSGLDLDRWGYSAILDHSPVEIGIFKLTGNVEFEDLFYEGGHNYRTIEGRFRLRYVDPPHWGTSLTYTKVYDWGVPPFTFDQPQTRDELGLREQTRFSRRWGAGFDWAWDFEDDEFERQIFHVTYIFDSFQMSVGWDFANEQARMEVALPGDLK